MSRCRIFHESADNKGLLMEQTMPHPPAYKPKKNNDQNDNRRD
jgi:hypothetical protein